MIFHTSNLFKRLRKNRWLSGLFLLSFFLFHLSEPVELEGAKKTSRSKVTINLPRTLILKEFVKIISENTGTVFVYEEKNMRGQMSITAPRNFKVTPEDAFFFFEKILASQGLAMVRKKGSKVVEILPAADARFQHVHVRGRCAYRAVPCWAHDRQRVEDASGARAARKGDAGARDERR